RTVPARAGFEFLKLQRYTRPYLKEVTVPVFIAHGRQDTIVPVQTVHYLQREIPSAKKQVVIFDRSRHLLCLGEDQHVLIRMVYEFLTSKSMLLSIEMNEFHNTYFMQLSYNMYFRSNVRNDML